MTKKWTKNTTLKYKRKKDIESLVFAAIDWCKNNLKSNKKLPMIWIDWAVQKRCYGEYCFTDNEIIIYPKIHTHVKDIVDTAIHEWVHFLQGEKAYDDSEKYKFYKSKNPTELEAIELANKYTNKCIKEICTK